MKLSAEQLNDLIERLIAWMNERLQQIGTKNVVVGISGGKDSSVVAALCVKAFGKERVYGVLMPDGEQNDIEYAQDLCKSLDIKHETINIKDITKAFYGVLGDCSFYETISRQTKLNMPPRVRMTVLYAVAQSLDAVVVNTSNLSEDWVGYATHYGDTTGAFSPLAMLTTDEVIQVGRTLGLDERFIMKPPSDGLTGKTDEDILGFTYEMLNKYIRTGVVPEDVEASIDRLHKISRFKFLRIPMFDSQLPIAADDIANIYKTED